MDYVMEVNNLSKSYKGRKVLKDISFGIYEGCITGFIGMNGAGKTTTIKSILGLLHPESGGINVFGMPMKEHEKAIKDRIGIVYDNGYLYNELTMGDMKGVIAPAYSHWDNQVYSSLMKRFRLDEKKKISELSRGMRMKYALVLALSHHADLLIMDEPTSGLDPMVRKQFLEIMREFVSEEGKSVFFSTHLTTDLDKIADQIIMLHKGKILFNEDKESLIEAHALVKGDKTWLNQENRQWFLALEEKGFHFEGLTHEKAKVRAAMASAVMERPTIEDIMVAYIEGRV